ncbi:hypothetical protein [Vibrio sp. HN007]|uniref:hypothetical protein n=1 Tax=Vibrio iocasae TaxID=3098914 RepID=UPI0035D47829
MFPVIELKHFSDLPVGQDRPTQYDIRLEKDFTLSVLAKIHDKPKELIVLFNGATSKDKLTKPNFSRWSWAEKTGYSYISISDPLVGTTDDLNLAWYVGTTDFDLQNYIQKCIKRILIKVGIEPNKVIFYGSSGGGFASIVASTYLRGSTAIVYNPQTNVLDYNEIAVDRFLNSFGAERAELTKECLYRFSISELMKRNNYLPNIIYKQNTQDQSHIHQHYFNFYQKYMDMTIGIGGYGTSLTTHLFHSNDGHSAISDINGFKQEIEACLQVEKPIERKPYSSIGLSAFNLDSKIKWVYDFDEPSSSTLSVSGLYDLTISEKNKPAILIAFDTDIIDEESLRSFGLGYSKSLKCAFKYIKPKTNSENFLFSLENKLGVKRVGFRIWSGANTASISDLKIECSDAV